MEQGTTWPLCWSQGELGDVVYVELPEVGKQVKKGETFGVVESVKVGGWVWRVGEGGRAGHACSHAHRMPASSIGTCRKCWHARMSHVACCVIDRLACASGASQPGGNIPRRGGVCAIHNQHEAAGMGRPLAAAASLLCKNGMAGLSAVAKAHASCIEAHQGLPRLPC